MVGLEVQGGMQKFQEHRLHAMGGKSRHKAAAHMSALSMVGKRYGRHAHPVLVSATILESDSTLP